MTDITNGVPTGTTENRRISPDLPGLPRWR